MKVKTTFLFLLLNTFVNAQIPHSSGNLIHLNTNDNSINPADTLGFWESGIDYRYSDYFDIVRTTQSLYLLRNNDLDPDYLMGYSSKEVENTATGKRQRYSYFSAIDGFSIFFLEPNTYKIENGTWLFDDFWGIGFLDNTDSLRDIEAYGNNLYHICGKVDSLYFIIWHDDYQAKYFLMDLKNSPELDTLYAIPLNFKCSESFGCKNKIVHIENIYENQYLIQTEFDINLYSFEADSFRFVKTVLENKYFQTFGYRNNNLFANIKNYDNTFKLLKYHLSIDDTTFMQEEILLEGDIFVDKSFNYAVKIESNILQLYNIDQGMVTKTWDLSNFNFCFKPLIDYPNVFFHQTKNVTSTVENKPDFVKEESITAYPNPFNSSIRFKVDFTVKKNSFFKIYNVSGSLIDKILYFGQANIIWSPRNVSSGIYFLILDSGKSLIKKKICYIK